MRRFSLATAGLGVLLVASFAACGGDDDGGTNGGGTTGDADVTVLALDIEFDQTSYDVAPGSVTIGYENEGSLNHTLLIEGVDGFKLSVAARGDTDSGTTDLEPGAYVMYCDVSGHRAAGMEADLTVG